MVRFEPVNTLQQDLFLLAKGQYDAVVEAPEQRLDRLTAGRLIVALHIEMDYSYIALSHLLHWLLEEFVKTDILFTDRERLLRFLKEPVRFNIVRQINDYHERMCAGLLDELTLLKVREGDSWICAVPKCQADPNLANLLHEEALRRINLATTVEQEEHRHG